MPIGGMSFVKEWMVGCENSKNGEKGGNGGNGGNGENGGNGRNGGNGINGKQSNWDHKYKLTISYSLSTSTKSS